jgi:phosphinothricin acetyltransferase
MKRLRLASEEDLPALVRIYNQAIAEGLRTGHTEPVDQDERAAWLAEHAPDTHPVLVCELAGKVAGYVSLSPYRQGRTALRRTAEISIYVDADHRRLGIATSLLRGALMFSALHDITTLIAIVIGANTASIGLLKRFGFARWGRLPDVVEFEGETYDHLYFGRKVEAARAVQSAIKPQD